MKRKIKKRWLPKKPITYWDVISKYGGRKKRHERIFPSSPDNGSIRPEKESEPQASNRMKRGSSRNLVARGEARRPNSTLWIRVVNGSVAACAYDAFGNTIAATGPLSTTFPHRFSTKYFDPETGLCYYGYRYYSPSLMRWINRDPIEEEGGVNLYAFCKNGPSCTFDKDGRAYFAYRPLAIASFVGVLGQETFNLENMVIAHENLFFEDGKKPSNLGFFPEGVHMDYDISGYRPSHTEHFNDCVMRKAVKLVHPKEYSLLGDDAHKIQLPGLGRRCQENVQ